MKLCKDSHRARVHLPHKYGSDSRHHIYGSETKYQNTVTSLSMSKREKFAELRALRASGKKRLDTYQIEDQGAIYDEVDEEGYKKVVRGRLNEDDFVVDDKGEGYADDGREEWQAERRYYSSEGEGVSSLKSGAAKRKRENEKEKNENTNHKIMNYFNNGPPSTAPKLRVRMTALGRD